MVDRDTCCPVNRFDAIIQGVKTSKLQAIELPRISQILDHSSSGIRSLSNYDFQFSSDKLDYHRVRDSTDKWP